MTEAVTLQLCGTLSVGYLEGQPGALAPEQVRASLTVSSQIAKPANILQEVTGSQGV